MQTEIVVGKDTQETFYIVEVYNGNFWFFRHKYADLMKAKAGAKKSIKDWDCYTMSRITEVKVLSRVIDVIGENNEQ